MIGELLGIPEADRPALHGGVPGPAPWPVDGFTHREPSPRPTAIVAYLGTSWTPSARDPADDLVSVLVTANDGDALTTAGAAVQPVPAHRRRS